MSKKYAIIVAGGRGMRLGGEVPKQFLEFGGKPVLMHSIEAFLRYDANINIVLVLPELQIPFWQELCKKHNFKQNTLIAKGGETRFHSVKNGLLLIDSEGLTAIHDGVRPFVSAETLERTFAAAEQYAAVVPVIDVTESIRFIEGKYNKAVDRTRYRLVQTPQVFQNKIIKEAYNQSYTPAFTDDASVVEASGAKVHLVAGNRENIKITTPFDLKVAESLFSVPSDKSDGNK